MHQPPPASGIPGSLWTGSRGFRSDFTRNRRVEPPADGNRTAASLLRDPRHSPLWVARAADPSASLSDAEDGSQSGAVSHDSDASGTISSDSRTPARGATRSLRLVASPLAARRRNFRATEGVQRPDGNEAAVRSLPVRPAFVGFSVNLILPGMRPGCSLEALTGILNSDLAFRWFGRHAKRRGAVNLEINAHLLRQFPLPRARHERLERRIAEIVGERQAAPGETRSRAEARCRDRKARERALRESLKSDRITAWAGSTSSIPSRPWPASQFAPAATRCSSSSRKRRIDGVFRTP